ncbi:MAG: hypothetical protein M0P14_08105 [Alkaliphilus sp.]|nr:hypothetical protein [Alkaliphilus sp.]
MDSNTTVKKINKKELLGTIQKIINSWPDWKKEAYNKQIALSPYVKKLKISR